MCQCSWSYVDNRIFSETDQYPWKLCKGKLETNLADLKDMERPPNEKVAQQMWQLMQMNYPVVCLVEVCKAMKQLPWSSIGCEQGHVGASIMKRYHPDIQENMLKCRSFFYQLQPMISPGEQWVRVAAMQKDIDKLLRMSHAF